MSKHMPQSKKYRRFSVSRRHALAAAVWAAMVASSTAQAVPLLRCFVSYAGSTQTLETTPTRNPYGTVSVDIQGRFSFKAVMVGSTDEGSKGDKGVDYIKLYAYRQTRDRDVPIHQATYLPPFQARLTPLNYLYAGDVERELQYHCTLEGITP